MIEARHVRLRVPSVMAVGGSIIALASLIGNGWKDAAGVEVVTVLATIGYYVLGGRDSDAGAMVGSRPDERQVSIQQQATAIAGHVMMLAALTGFVVTTALGHFQWPFTLFIFLGSITYVAAFAWLRRRYG
jgi:hypothetical protein